MKRLQYFPEVKLVLISVSIRPHRLAWPRTPDFHSDNRGSNPLGVNNETLAQSVEHLTFNERVDGSSPSSLKLHVIPQQPKFLNL